jgi:dihydroorotate dehydrogenase
MWKLYEKLIKPVMFRLDAETAHEIGMQALRLGLVRAEGDVEERSLEIERFGLKFRNPLGVAAGFDKNGVAVNQLAALGFGFVEVGTVTLRPQKGNEKPRLFRLPRDQALINRLGFNNEGAKIVAGRLSQIDRKCIVGVNIGKNKDVPNEQAVENYLATFELVHPVADYIAVNVSSPNTPNLRELQKGESLKELIDALSERNRSLGRKPLLVKIAPDLTEAEIEAIVEVSRRTDLAGIIATNTTLSRSGLSTSNVDRFGAGGLSGRPLAHRSSQVIASVFRQSDRRLPIIGVGGVFNAVDAFDKVRCGASLLQAYTGFVYQGPAFAPKLNRGLKHLLELNGFRSIDDAVGVDVA